MASAELFEVVVGLVSLLLAAHLVGRLFARFRQPSVVGEILGGLLLGPTVLGQLAPDAQRFLFPTGGAAAVGVSLVYQLGMLLLMFTAGVEMRTVFSRENRATVAVVSVVGMLVPFGIGLLMVTAIDTTALVGPANDVTGLTLMIACAIAVTSIPVISRIMLDLGIIRSRFARMVLSVAVLEDIVLNVIISITLGMVAARGDEGFGLAVLLGIDATAARAVYHVVVSLAFFAATAMVAAWIRRGTGGRPPRSRPGEVAGRMTVLLSVVALCVFLGVAPIFGAFVVGLMSGRRGRPDDNEALVSIRRFSSGFFIPIYFAVVGLKLDLVHALDPWFTAGFVLVACVAKGASVYLGARMTHRSTSESANLALALNARGGPGIVLATVAYDAGIVNESLFTTLILTAVGTSQLAGWALEVAVRRGTLQADDNTRVPTGPGNVVDDSHVPAEHTPGNAVVG
ncbi:cation:proton antiporter [Micromonospora sp. WMMA1363]|uniref:cation:proton antiporter n=1 Tax=Micromonospora sp. WMMA1363 TaxID=3053985 RepID=UPI00259CAED5|nr:cation:proton antiporter [Micromonospora sp. WMMA1363]MDM4721532.1 cation:proton antiporter [Micromonospora sp. WMMA1363]